MIQIAQPCPIPILETQRRPQRTTRGVKNESSNQAKQSKAGRQGERIAKFETLCSRKKNKKAHATRNPAAAKKASRHFPLFAQTPKAQKEEAVPQELLKRKAMLNAHGIGESQNSPEEELFPRAKADRNKTVERG
jgi:hypothetical protein